MAPLDGWPLFKWRDAWCSVGGPPAITRLVLWTISKHMNMEGASAFPNQQTIARESGLGLRAVKRHLQKAEQLGWLTRAPRVRNGRASWRYGTDYRPAIPEKLVSAEHQTLVSQEHHIGVPRSTIGVRRGY